MIPAFVRNHTVASIKTAGTNNLTLQVISPGVAAGNLLVAWILFDNAATASKPVVSSIGKPGAETANWVFLGAARSTSTSAGAFASGEMWAIRTTVAWANQGVAVTLDTSVTMKAGLFQEFSGAQAVLRSTVGTAYSTTTTQASAVTTGTAPVVNDLVLGFIFGSNVAVAQAGSNSSYYTGIDVGVGTTGGSGATNNFGVAQYGLMTSTSHVTSANAGLMTAGNGSIVAVLQFIPDPAITQAAYQFFDDAGTESGAAALAALNTPVTGNLSAGDGYGMVRVRLQSTTAIAVSATDDWQLQYQKNGGAWNGVYGLGAETRIDGVDPATQSTTVNLQPFGSSDVKMIAQQVVGGSGLKLSRVTWMIRKVGSPTGTLDCRASNSGAGYGNYPPSTPTSWTVTSAPVSMASLPTTLGHVSFDFTPTMALTTNSADLYLYADAGDGTNYVQVGQSAEDPAYSGGGAGQYQSTGGGFAYSFATARVFTAYGRFYSAEVAPYDNPNLTEGAATTNRLGAGTGSFVAGKVAEDGQVNDIGWAGNNYTEILFSVKLIAAALADGDTLNFRVLRNGSTTGMTYAVTPTINLTVTPPPHITFINPTGAMTEEAIELGVAGTNFVNGDSIRIAGTTYPADFISDTELYALITLPASLGNITSTLEVVGVNGTSNAVSFDISSLRSYGSATAGWTATPAAAGVMPAVAPKTGSATASWSMTLPSSLGPPTLTDGYAETNHSGTHTITTGNVCYGVGFTVLGNGQKLSSVSFWMQRSVAVAPVDLIVELYAHTGTFGSTGKATGTALASAALRSPSVVGTSLAWVDFTFDGSYTLVNGTPYAITLRPSVVDNGASGTVSVSLDSSSPTHPGNSITRNSGGTWDASSTQDRLFRLYTQAMPSAVGARTSKGTAAATHAWTPSATGVRPAATANQGTATTSWSMSTGGGVVYTDNFDRANGALGAPWVTVEGALTIASNKLVAPSGGGPHTSRYDQTFSNNQWAEGDVTGAAGGGYAIGPAVRINDNGDLYYLWLGTGSDVLEIYRRVSGGYQLVGGPVTCPSSFKARLEAEGTTIRAFVDGVVAITATNADIATGYPGVLGNQGPTQTFDNFRCGSLPYGAGGPVGKRIPKGTATTSWTATATAVGVRPATILAVSASGTGTSAGSAVIARTLPVAASGTGISAGSIALTAILRAAGSGTGLSAGSAAIARALPVAASGTGLSAGSAALISVLRVAASGTGTSTGSAAVGILGGAVDHPISASGTGTSTGTVALISTLAVAATGTGLSAGQATLARAMPTSAAGTGLTGGTAAFTPIAMSASGSGQTAGSVALISTLVVRGVGTGTSAGSAAISRGHPLTASGTGTSFGSVAIGTFTGPIDHSMAGHGLMQSGGSVALISSLAMRGVGTGQTTGIATLRRIMPIAAGGSGLSGGSVSISRSMPLVASGTGQTAGAIALRREMPLSAVGVGTFAGAVAIKVGGQMSLTAAGLGRFRGSVSIFLKVPMVDVNVTVGALREVEQFAIGEMRGGETAVGGYGEDVFEVSDFTAVASVGQIRLDVLFGFGEMDGEVTIGDLEATPPVTIGGFSAASSVGPLRED